MLIGRKAATNVVATMLIFGIMIASVGVLYSQIAPALLGYETTTTTTNQNFVFDTVSQEYLGLASSSEGTVSLVHIISEQTSYDLDYQRTLTFDLTNSSGSMLPANFDNSIEIGAFEANVNGSFLPSDPRVENRVFDPSTFMNNDSNDANYVLTSQYSYSEGEFSMYFRSRIDTHFIASTNTWKMTITILQMTFLPSFNGSPSAFPVEIPEWTLRMRRQPTNLTTLGPFTTDTPTLTHDVDGVAGPAYIFPAIDGQLLEIDIITIPILFGI